MEIPYASIGDASGEFWYQHAYWGLLLSAAAAALSSAAILVFTAFCTIKQLENSIKTEKFITWLLALGSVRKV